MFAVDLMADINVAANKISDLWLWISNALMKEDDAF